MKLYEFPAAVNAQRVRVFLAEKGVDLPSVTVDVRAAQQFDEPHSSMNPFHCVPFLEIEDGTVIAESVSICRYVEEHHPEPSLFGATPAARAVIDMWNRRAELDGFMPILHAVRNTVPMFEGRVVPGTRNDLPQSPEIAAHGVAMFGIFLERLDAQLQRATYVAGDEVSIADITAYFSLKVAERLDADAPTRLQGVERWHRAFSERASVTALQAGR